MRRILLLALLVVALAPLSWLATGCPVHYGTVAEMVATSDSSPSPSYSVQRLAIATTTGRHVTCLLRRPTETTVAGSPVDSAGRQALVLAGGEEGGRRAALLVDPAYAGIVLSCDYPWSPLVSSSVIAMAWRLPRLRAELLATPELLRVAADALWRQPDVDTMRVAAAGASLGVPPVAAWAARDPRPRAVALLYGGGHLERQLAITFEREIGAPAFSRLSARLVAWLLGPLEPTRTAGLIAPRPLLIVGARDDERVPLAGIQALYAAALEPRRLVLFGGAHMHPSNAELLRQLADTTIAWLGEVLPRGGDRQPH